MFNILPKDSGTTVGGVGEVVRVEVFGAAVITNAEPVVGVGAEVLDVGAGVDDEDFAVLGEFGEVEGLGEAAREAEAADFFEEVGDVEVVH